MSRAAGLADHIERTVTGPMWHGPALLDVLKDVACDRALARPLANAHTIWDLVLHITAWCDIARQRLKGQSTTDPAPDQDWPPMPAGEGSDIDLGAEWDRAVAQLAASHRALAADTRLLTDEQIAARIPGLDYSASVLLRGVIEHGTY